MILSEQEKTRIAAEQVDDRIAFYVHFAAYILVIAILAAVDYADGPAWWVQWPAMGWGLGIIGHGLAVFGRTPRFVAEWRLKKIRETRNAMGGG